MTTATAPGKVMLAGEYAVLEGAEAILMAVDRRARARLERTPQTLSPFLAAARDVLAETLGTPAADAAWRVSVDTGALASESGIKLGLGSSAAATVSAIACALAAIGDDAAPARVHALAHRAHAAAQAPRGARGSGADVAAAVHGGLIGVTPRGADTPAVRPISLPDELALDLVWTGAAADTPSLVARVRALADADAAEYERRLAAIAAAARELAGAGDAAAAVNAVAAAGRAVQALGSAAKTPLWTEAHDRIAAVATPLGAACKPTGAGGGDLALCASPSAAISAAVRAGLRAAGMRPLDLNVEPTGVRWTR